MIDLFYVYLVIIKRYKKIKIYGLNWLLIAQKYSMLKINEIFFSIQGESTYTGKPCIFICLSECNLRCVWCDTEYAFYEGTELSIDDILKKIGEYNCKLVEITGGEPLIQEEVYQLIDRLQKLQYTVLIETGGSISISKLNHEVIKIMDIKCPGSKMESKMDFSNIDLLTKNDEAKFVVLNAEDYRYAKDIISRYDLTSRTNVLMSPVHDVLSSRTLAEWILADGLDVRLQVQFHKYIWSKDDRKV